MKRRVRFIEERGGRETVVEADPGERLTQVAHRGGIVIQQTCANKAACTDCRIIVKENVNDAFEAAVGAELRQLGNVYFITHERLACQAVIKGDSAVWVPDPEQIRKKKQKVRK